ncbi:hypothetical protein MUN82_18045 [Hymenobacter aerilatus]|uniref:Uncharacterized protein n=1 Tax=Hymenobacter aerilatus TaxID=2932251 RepID=A0A8T9SU03_9BACT|nr:hypothetical protein [Hymenobacter aerilatus]UOR04831.1 hypothetical protein MUN82_18045 [Hymenobacter aerilatus]
MAFRFDKSLGRTVLFSVAVVSFIIAVYQTILQNSIGKNYELYMVSFVCVMWFRYLGLDDKAATKDTPATRPGTAAKVGAKSVASKSKSKRRK